MSSEGKSTDAATANSPPETMSIPNPCWIDNLAIAGLIYALEA